MSPEYFIVPLIMNQINKFDFKTGIYLLDTFIVIIAVTVIFTLDIQRIKIILTKKLEYYMNNNNNISIILTSDSSQCSIKYRAVMYYISQLNEKTIYCLKEKPDFEYDYQKECSKETNSEYTVDQMKQFILCDDIYGIHRIDNKEKSKSRDLTEYKESNILTIYTYRKTLLELQNWINDRISSYNKYLIDKTLDKQLLVTIQQQGDDLSIEPTNWESNITFENSYLPEKDKIMKKIDFFLKNKSWYKKNGIPYNLGILLYGEPGCGKTRFIKQLLNYTSRHAIDIKLNDRIDLNEISKIVNSDMVDTDLIIPQDNRIIIFEDIDGMGDIVKARTDDKPITSANDNSIEDLLSLGSLLKDNIESSIKTSKADNDKNRYKNKKNNMNKPSNNNLSFLLNMIDGLNECSGRIIIITTNRINFLDKALIRPGRIDLKIEFIKCSCNDIYMMYRLYWKDDTMLEQSIKPELDKKYTSAEIMNMFRSYDDINNIKNLLFV